MPKVAIDVAGWSVATWVEATDYAMAQANSDYNHGIIQAERQKVRFPLSIDLIDKISWSTLAGVLTYNIYSDAGLTQLVESYTGSNFYFRHQMKKGVKHYYFRVTTANFTSSALDIELP